MEVEDDWYKNEQEYWRKVAQSDEKVMSRLKKSLKSKVYDGIVWEMKQHCGANHLEIVKAKSCTGTKTSYSDYAGFSSPIRYIYDDVSNDSYSGSYGGLIYLSIGHGNYLKMHIWG